ncbi:MAG: 30S ribosomal protein THX [Bacteroidetes bacterium]|jgi:30S ribosomal protein S31|nr:30S ribosomal protein THX [Bacteroidota bacterium]
MGRGDKKSRKGKIQMGSYGVTRPRKTKKKVVAAATPKPAKKAAAKKAPAKKTAKKS